MNLFAYGTLRPEASRFALIADQVVAQVEGSIEGRLFVLPEGNPILVEGSDAGIVKGELLLLPDLPQLLRDIDRIEGIAHPASPYHRVQRQVQTVRGDDIAFVYVCKPDRVSQVTAGATELHQGDWFAWSESGGS